MVLAGFQAARAMDGLLDVELVEGLAEVEAVALATEHSISPDSWPPSSITTLPYRILPVTLPLA